MSTSRAIFHMFLAVTFFAVMNLCVHYLKHIPAHEVVLFRSVVSLAIAVGMLLHRRMFSFGKRIDLLVLRGLFGSAALLTFFMSMQKLPLATGVTIQYLSPVVTSILALFLLGERMVPLQWVAYGVAFLGVVVIKWDGKDLPLPYVGLGVLSAFFSALAYTTIRRMKDSDHPLVVVMYFPLVAIPVSAVWCAFDWVMPTGWDWLWLLGTGITAQLGQVFMTKSLVAERANIVSSVHYLGVVYAVGFGFILFDEHLTWMTLLGIVLVCMGVVGNLLKGKG